MTSERRIQLGTAEIRGISPEADQTLNDRLQRIEAAIRQVQQRAILDEEAVAPGRAYNGEIRFADGVTWDPNGEGIPQHYYYYNGNWYPMWTGAVPWFTFAAYAGLIKTGVNEPILPLDATWYHVTQMDTDSVPPYRMSTDALNGALIPAYEGVYYVSVMITLTHNSLAGGSRVIGMRITNQTTLLSTDPVYYITGRDADGTNMSLGILFTVTAAAIGNNIIIEIGGGDNYTNVEIRDAAFSMHSVGRYYTQTPGAATVGDAFSNGFDGGFS